tara:strand:+ start:242 stop:532 length:291 start_codon:yes stop_codon:yes gene_type:complete
MCVEDADCQEQQVLDQITLEYPDYEVDMDDLLCGYYEIGEGEEEDGEILYNFCTHSSACETEGSLDNDQWWYVGCDDGASQIAVAGATALLLAMNM